MEPSTKRAPADPSFVAETRFTGAIVTCLWPREAVARLLPPALRLDAAHTRRGRHPVVFIFGEHDRSTVFYATLALPTGVRFLEFMVAVPYVRAANGNAEPAMFLPCVFSGEPVATWSGNAHYGLKKRMVPMEWLGNTFVVSDERGALVASFGCEPLVPWSHAAAGVVPALDSVVAFGRLAILGYRADGRLIRSRFDWSFDEAWVRRVRARMVVEQPLAGEATPTVHRRLTSHSIEVARMRWRLSWPDVRREA